MFHLFFLRPIEAWIYLGSYNSIKIDSSLTFALSNDSSISKKGLFLCRQSNVFNGNCTFDNDCMNSTNLVCNQTKCICKNITQHWSEIEKKCVSHYGEDCLEDFDCQIGLKCKRIHDQKVCSCPLSNGREQYHNTLINKCSSRTLFEVFFSNLFSICVARLIC